jgi:hypothetical protein
MSMTKKIQDNLKPGQRFIFIEGRAAVKLLIEVTKKPEKEAYSYRTVVPVKILGIMKDSYDNHYVGESDKMYPDKGTWRYLKGQDAPKKNRKKK